MTHFKCPYCNHDQIATESQQDSPLSVLRINNKKYGPVGFTVIAISCANPDCREIQLSGRFSQLSHITSVGWRELELIQEFQLKPNSRALPQPECIPAPLAADYYEACAIEALSPKASATLSRRCIQGMIRDFCGISEKTLFAEITKLTKQVEAGTAAQGVTEDTIAAIDSVRSIGNIGAHMEADINVLVDIDPGEAQALIELIELLFADWYVAREGRRQRLEKVRKIAADKKKLIEEATQISQVKPLALLGQSGKPSIEEV